MVAAWIAWLPGLVTGVRVMGGTIGPILFFWVWTLLCFGSIVVLQLRYPRCPSCDTPLLVWYKNRFMQIVAPWPRRRCGVCGADLTAPGA